MKRPPRHPVHRPAGFTLVEMLVATALVLLIMLLFAQIYGAAMGTIAEQKGLANNDSKARIVDNIIRRDLGHLTFRQISGEGVRGICPLASGDVVDPRQAGFFYYSENDPSDPTDDTLHYTIDVNLTHRHEDSSPLFGKAVALAGSNDPDNDDGVAGNVTGMSTRAEVMIFLRGGKLYRQVKLLREPLGAPLSQAEYDEQPSTTAAVRVPLWAAAGASSVNGKDYTGGAVYNSFDFVVTRVADGNGDSYFRFLGISSLDNSRGLVNVPIAAPRYRTGFVPNAVTSTNNLLATPVEFDNTDSSGSTNDLYIGRFTQAEMSHVDYVFPGVATDPRIPPAGATTFVLNTDYLISGYDDQSSNNQPGPRRGADLLMQNVSQFDIEVLDPAYVEIDLDNADGDNNIVTGYEDLNSNGIRDVGAWVSLGHNFGLSAGYNPGRYSQSGRTTNTTVQAYGPNGPLGNWVFDTWHPSIIDPATSNPLPPPYRPLRFDPTTYFVPGVNGTWAAHQATGSVSTASGVGQSVVYPDAATNNSQFVYVCISGNGNSVGSKEPEWPRQHGAIVRENSGTNNEVVWQCYDNRIGLESMRITLRYLDPGSGLERQLTIIHSFVE